MRTCCIGCVKNRYKVGGDLKEKYRHDHAFVYLLTYAGLRVEELSNLKLTDLDLKLKRIRIVGKGIKVRTVPISFTMATFLKLSVKKNDCAYLSRT
ncbi:site-specific recombinase XerC [Anoxybacillus rupiensis]|nr:site-specific recombinase XerC [Anoxybacillus rupiensis]